MSEDVLLVINMQISMKRRWMRSRKSEKKKVCNNIWFNMSLDEPTLRRKY